MGAGGLLQKGPGKRGSLGAEEAGRGSHGSGWVRPGGRESRAGGTSDCLIGSPEFRLAVRVAMGEDKQGILCVSWGVFARVVGMSRVYFWQKGIL